MNIIKKIFCRHKKVKLFVGIGRTDRMAMTLDSLRFRESVQIVENISSRI